MRERFFERGVDAINVLTGKNDAFYYCPICTRSFSKTALDSNELTLEHIPPEAQGGKGIALTCSRCNHTAGNTVDAAVSDRNKVFEIEPLITQAGEYNGRVRLNFGEKGLDAINCDLSIKDSSVRIYLLKDRNHPDSSERIKDFFQRLNKTPDHDRPNINISTRKRYHPWHSKVGDLRTAYLLCFASLGYSYVFNKRLEPVRNQLMRYSEKVIEAFWLQSDHNDEPDTNLYIIDKPFSAISVRLGKISVLLPWFDSPEDFYSFLLHEYPKGGHMNFTGSRLPWPTTLEMNLDFYKKNATELISKHTTMQLTGKFGLRPIFRLSQTLGVCSPIGMQAVNTNTLASKTVFFLILLSAACAPVTPKPAETPKLVEIQKPADLEEARKAFGSKDYAKAMRLLRPLAEQGNAVAQSKVGLLYSQGWGVSRDLNEALKWFRKAADQGNPEAQYAIGAMYADGLGVPKDDDEAVNWYRKAAEQGHTQAKFNLGMAAFRRGEDETALRELKPLAEAGDARAENLLGKIFETRKDYVEAVKWYEKAAKKGLHLAQNDLGHLYVYGLGVPKSRKEAAKWFRMAAEQGDDVAQVNLGNLYYYGYEIGKDYSKALNWFGKAADKGNTKANLMLARMYRAGEGVAKDEKEAERRLTLALKDTRWDAALIRASAGFKVGRDGYFIVWPRPSNQPQPEVEELDDFLIALNYAEVVRKLQTKPDDPIYLSWLQNRAEEGHPQLQLLLSQRLLKTDPIGALMWLILGTLGTAQDAVLCQDHSARAATPVMLAGFVMQVQKNPRLFEEALKRGLEWDRKHIDRPPPVAICFHGMQAYPEPSKYPRLIPESEWLSERLKIRDEVLRVIPELLSQTRQQPQLR